MDFGIFGIGFHQIMFILLVALIVFGPDKLPGIARQAGRYVNDLRRMTQEARGEIQALTKDLDLREDLNAVKADLLEIKNDLSSTGTDLMKEFQEVSKQVDLRDEAGNLMGQQREQYTVQVIDNPTGSDSLRVEETIRRETVIQEAVENEPAYGVETIELTESQAMAGSDTWNGQGIIRPATPLPVTDAPAGIAAETSRLEPRFEPEAQLIQAEPLSAAPVVNSSADDTVLPVAVPEPAAAYQADSVNANGNGYHPDQDKLEQIGLELRLMEQRWQDDRRELYRRVEELERQFMERLDRIELALAARYDATQPAQGN